MRWLPVFVLLAFNGFAALQASAFLVTFADLPAKSQLPSCEPSILAAALGHAYHSGGESMRSFLGAPFLWVAGAAAVNFVAAVVALAKRPGRAD